MSDETPTQRFDATPGTPGSSPGSATPPSEDQKKGSRGVLIALIALGAVLLIAVIVLLALLFGGNGTPTEAESPSSSSTPSAASTSSNTPSATPNTTPTTSTTTTTAPTKPTSTGPTVDVFTSSTDVQCNSKTGNPIPLKFAWRGKGDAAYFAAGATDDPKNNGFNQPLPTTGNQSDFPDGDILYPCYQQKAIFTIGIYDSEGNKAVKQLVVTNNGEVK